MARRTKAEIEAALDAAIEKKHIWNVDFVGLKDDANRLVDNADRDAGEEIYKSAARELREKDGDNYYARSKHYNEITYFPMDAHGLISFGKKLARFAKTLHQDELPVLAQSQKFYDDHKALAEKLAMVKQYVVKGRKPNEAKPVSAEERKALLAEKAKLQQEISYGRFTMGMLSMKRSRVRAINAILRATDAMKFGTSPVAIAIIPLKEAAMEYAREQAVAFVKKLKETLEKAAWDLDSLAPRPTKDDDRFAANAKNSRRVMFLQVLMRTAQDTKVSGWRWNQAGADRVVKNAVEEAAQVFDAFVTKMDHKIGDHDTAKVEGTPWLGCDVTITKSGLTEVWHTQQIVNYSVYGKAYNQWPTRLMD